MPINKDVITKEMFLKALQCKTAEKLCNVRLQTN